MFNLRKGLILANRMSGNGRTITDLKKNKEGVIISVQFDNSKWIDAKKLHNFRLPTEEDLSKGNQESYGRTENVHATGNTGSGNPDATSADTARTAKVTGKRGRKHNK